MDSGAHQYLRSWECDEPELLLGNASQRSAVFDKRKRILVSAVAFCWGELGVGVLIVGEKMSFYLERNRETTLG